MKFKKTDIKGTIHDLANQLVNLSKLDEIKPTTTKQKNSLLKKFKKLDLFHKNTSEERKKEIIANLKIMNFDEAKIVRELQILKSIEKFNRIVNKKRRELEDEAVSGKNSKINYEYLANRQKIEIEIPREIRNDLRIYEKAVRLKPFGKSFTKNKIAFNSGQDYNFIIKTGFGPVHVIPYNEMQKIRREGNVVEYILKLYKADVERTYQEDKKLYSKSDPKKWKQKQKVYNKIFNALEHNLAITTDKKYNKKLVKYNKDGSVKKEEGEYPINMKIFDDLIDVYV